LSDNIAAQRRLGTTEGKGCRAPPLQQRCVPLGLRMAAPPPLMRAL
jgi:hypothetical protein